MTSNGEGGNFSQPSTRPIDHDQHKVIGEGHHDPDVSSQILTVLSKMKKSLDTNNSLIANLLHKEDLFSIKHNKRKRQTSSPASSGSSPSSSSSDSQSESDSSSIKKRCNVVMFLLKICLNDVKLFVH